MGTASGDSIKRVEEVVVDHQELTGSAVKIKLALATMPHRNVIGPIIQYDRFQTRNKPKICKSQNFEASQG
jgi:hypothetical protein